MTNDERNPNDEMTKKHRRRRAFGVSSLGILSSFVIRHSKEPPPQSAHPAPKSSVGKFNQRHLRFVALRVQLFGLGERSSCRSNHSQGLLASTQLQPKHKLRAIPFNGLLQQL